MKYNYMLAFARHTLPFFISFPSYLVYFTAIYLFTTSSPCKVTQATHDFYYGFYIVNCFIAAPLFSGILIDYVGVVITLPIFESMVLIGSIIGYFSLNSGAGGTISEPMALVGVFFIFFGFSLKEIGRIVYIANTFIEKKQGTYYLRTYAIQFSLAIISQQVILLLNSILPEQEDCQGNLTVLAFMGIGSSSFGFLANILLYYLNKYETKHMENNRSLISQLDHITGDGNVFMIFNNRLAHSDGETPTLFEIIKLIRKEPKLAYMKFWLVGAPCLATLSNLISPIPLYSNIEYLGYSLMIAFTIPLILFIKEKYMRWMMIGAIGLLVIYHIYNMFGSVYLNWMLAIALPVGLLVTDMYIPVLLNFQFKYLGTVVGMKKLLDTFLMMWTIMTHENKYVNKFYKLFLSLLGLLFIGLFSIVYSKTNSNDRRSAIVPLLESDMQRDRSLGDGVSFEGSRSQQ